VDIRPEDKKVLRDGERLRVPLVLMDELQRSVVANRLHDGFGNQAGHKPGFVFVAGHDETPTVAAYCEYVKHIGGAFSQSAPGEASDPYADYVAGVSNAWRSS
jgi:hypothetical protein